MKRIFYPLKLLFFVLVSFTAGNDYYLLAENFFLHKGDKLNVKIFSGILPQKDDYYVSPKPSAPKFELYEGSKKADVPASTKDSILSIPEHEMLNSGLALLHLTHAPVIHETESEDYVKHLETEDMAEAATKAKSIKDEYIRERYSRFLKTLVMVDKQSGNVFDKVLGDEYEIVLKNNPYKLNYGDDITGLLYFKGKLLQSGHVDLYIRTSKGSLYPERFVTDANGQFFFKLSREGIYMLKAVRTEASADKNADFDTWWTSYTFAFSSANELPNTYKEFGFGDKH
ncbi:DUF4198 domain-containing protein [Mucilaginibacter gynuensis]|uniref:DUF4198 domain-containing protein n=1 Tax=Mucilaginibacter gynuensis TaxID=1302236 RepID=A0ABP8GV58_9SPHI